MHLINTIFTNYPHINDHGKQIRLPGVPGVPACRVGGAAWVPRRQEMPSLESYNNM